MRRNQVRHIVVCACCGRTGAHHAFGWIHPCYRRWAAAGKPSAGPPAPFSRPRKPHPGCDVEQRLEEYLELTYELGLTRDQAAERLNVSVRTAVRYEARLRDQAQQGAA